MAQLLGVFPMTMKRRTFPIKWVNLVTFDKKWLEGKTITYYDDAEGVRQPRVFDAEGVQVYPK